MRILAGVGADERKDYAPDCGDGTGFGDAAGRRRRNQLGQSARRKVGGGTDHALRRVGSEMHDRVRGEARRSRIWLRPRQRSEEHKSELQSLMRISYAVFCLKKNILIKITNNIYNTS